MAKLTTAEMIEAIKELSVLELNELVKAQLQEIAEMKMPDLNAATVEAAMSMVAGTCRSMGVVVEE